MLLLCLLWVSLVLGGVAGYLVGCRPTPHGRGVHWTRVRVGRPVWQLHQGFSRLPAIGDPFPSPLRLFQRDEG